MDSIGGITRPAELRPELGVEVERGGRPADLVGVLDQRLAALERHHARELVGARAQPGRDLVQQLAALDRRAFAAHAAAGLARGGDRGVDLLGARRAPTSASVSSVAGFSTASGGAVAGDLLAADQQPGLHGRDD